jgi:hypothetical protein
MEEGEHTPKRKKEKEGKEKKRDAKHCDITAPIKTDLL